MVGLTSMAIRRFEPFADIGARALKVEETNDLTREGMFVT